MRGTSQSGTPLAVPSVSSKAARPNVLQVELDCRETDHVTELHTQGRTKAQKWRNDERETHTRMGRGVGEQIKWEGNFLRR